MIKTKKIVYIKFGGYKYLLIFDSVFHRILDFKTGLDVYPDPSFFYTTSRVIISFFDCKIPANPVPCYQVQ